MRTRPLLVFLLIISTFSTFAQESPPENIFGIVEGMWLPELTCELNPGWERIIFDWRSHQPDGPDDWYGFFNIDDHWLQAASDCNREIVAVVKNTPAWATDGSPGAGIPRGLDLPINDPGNVWANFMQQMGSYYASRGVHRFIIWNEPDIQAGTYGFEFEGDLEDYFRLVKVAYLAVKQGNPHASIHLAGTTYWHDVNSGDRLYTDRLLERISEDPDGAQHGYYFDALSLHIYFRTDTIYDIVNIYRDLLDQHSFANKAIWITETNTSPNLDPDWPVVRPQFQITLRQQANFVIQAAALGLAAGAERIAVYKLYDQQLPEGGESFGLLYPADASPRPAFYAWKWVTHNLNGAQSATLARNDRVNIVRIDQQGSRQTLIMWARRQFTTQIEITAANDKVYLVDHTGTEQLIHAEDGRFMIDLAGASCEVEEGCVVGGDVQILILPAGEITLIEITPENRYPLQFN